MTAQVHEELYCSSDDAADEAGEAAGGGVVAAGSFIQYCTTVYCTVHTVQCSYILNVI